jgi:hypothetical protein
MVRNQIADPPPLERYVICGSPLGLAWGARQTFSKIFVISFLFKFEGNLFFSLITPCTSEKMPLKNLPKF